MSKTPTGLSATSPKLDNGCSVCIQSSHVQFGGGRRGPGMVARVESLRGWMGESTRQAENLFESLLSESFSY